jgi:hypothetical protein
MQVPKAVTTVQSFRHDETAEIPALEKTSRTGHPKCKIITLGGSTAVVFDYAAEAV